jgi:thymidylate synthase
VLPNPVMLTIENPKQRVLFCPIRNANPFFHVMETVWMLAGERDVHWLKRFNRNIVNYADEGVIHGAYGYRWFVHWGDQIARVIKQLQDDPETRQAVISMWDPATDWQSHWKDRPCNVALMFRHVNGGLNMTVCNRSNDFVWGMMGANAVHLTYLHELIATAVGIPVGEYIVFTNNLHFYVDLYPNAEEIWASDRPVDPYPLISHYPLLQPDEYYKDLLQDCYNLVNNEGDQYHTLWMRHVALPIYMAYLDKETDRLWVNQIKAKDWRMACLSWLERNRWSKPKGTEPTSEDFTPSRSSTPKRSAIIQEMSLRSVISSQEEEPPQSS